jgi:MSHA biogenesis protein MshJ
MKAFKAWWVVQAARIDALSLRERGFLFVSVIAVFLALADVLLLSPAQIALQQVRQRATAQTADLARLRDELRLMAKPVDASKDVRYEIAVFEAQLEAVNADIKVRVPTADIGPALEKVLVQFLRRQDGLTLVRMGTVGDEPSVAGATGAAAGGGPASTTPNAPAGLVKRGLELKVSGPYAELVRYVKALETALPSLRWGMLQLKSDKQPPELTLQVYVVGLSP